MGESAITYAVGREAVIASREVPDISALRAHDAATLFPIMGDAELQSLADDIRLKGLRNPVVLVRVDDEYFVLDGRNRILACRVASVEPRWSLWEGTDPVGYVVSENLRRRHLDESQRAMVAAKLANLRKGQRADRVDGSIDLSTAARRLNVSEPSVKRARAVLDSGDEGLIASVEAGKLSVSAAAAISSVQGNSSEWHEISSEPAVESKPSRSLARKRKEAEVRRLHDQGLGTMDIARKMSLPQSSVSHLKRSIGVRDGIPANRLWSEISQLVIVFEAAESRVRRAAQALSTTKPETSREEIKRCTKSLSSATGAIRSLASALRSHLA